MSNMGSRYRDVYHAVIQDDGRVELEVVGKEDMQDFINSFKDSCDIELLVSKAVNGDPTALMQKQGFYGDFTSMPKTYAEMLQRVNDAKVFFDGLPVDKKANYNNSFEEFVVKLGNIDTLVDVGILEKKVDEVKDYES